MIAAACETLLSLGLQARANIKITWKTLTTHPPQAPLEAFWSTWSGLGTWAFFLNSLSDRSVEPRWRTELPHYLLKDG